MIYTIKNLNTNQELFRSNNLEEAQTKFQEFMLTKPHGDTIFYTFEESEE
jgi:hypothetical protein